MQKYAEIFGTFKIIHYLCSPQRMPTGTLNYKLTYRRKMNRAPVAKKVLRYLAHAEGICLSGG